ncbi:DUF2188 domain-containing protein [Sorangium sp. So ce128]|uniref:DUF2188 domain-containing protein n=1 Tax=Sorangium sp. So ce128 TaxID=3133281 RepID=UPI003F60236A
MGEVVTYEVVPIGKMWKVGMTGDSQADSIHEDKDSAIARAEQLARQLPLGQVVVQTDEGGVERSYFLGEERRAG